MSAKGTDEDANAAVAVWARTPSSDIVRIIGAKDAAAYAFGDAGEYSLGPDSFAQPGVPRGTLSRHVLTDSVLYPCVSHSYALYRSCHCAVEHPASLIVFLDGDTYLAPEVDAAVVLDNLSHKGEVPPLAGVFLNPGDEGPGLPLWGGTDNRSLEYDSIDDRFARFLIEEVFPDVARSQALSTNPDDRCIVGTSSGGNAAFTAAWQRPDAFRKVVSFVGSFTAIRGGNLYPSLIRKSEKRSLRVFLQSGARDLDIVFGNWPIANQDMASALAYRGYDYRFVFGDGGHSLKHGASILPDVLRWIWRDLS
jgi:enterochelin esterase family protein